MPYHGKTNIKTSFKLFKEGYFDKCNKLILSTILQFKYETRKNGILMNKKIKHLIQIYPIMSFKEVN
ncbi:unnamed protein product [Paramecium pentaurelia]|uniref:Uncharacterized protein n=1 Tax=Paramecium pentaurelia TaxID=43138 RepID=A0A8S1VU49_9CILI|nr:unnamed protein product [Paramecium pentaurelia]